MAASRRVICFGELLVRLTPQHGQRLARADGFDLHVGGAEANVAIALAQWGHEVSLVSAVPDNALGERVIAHLKSFGVNCDLIRRAPGRLGLYFAEEGAVTRAAAITYDRAGSVFTDTHSDAYDWPSILDGAGLAHVSGITPATGEAPCEATLEMARAAIQAGVPLSFDGNYRESLWKNWAGDGPAVLAEILSLADIAFINERDMAVIQGGEVRSRDDAVRTAFETWSGLNTIACTSRQVLGARDMTLGANLYSRSLAHSKDLIELRGVVERIGGGDAFAAGILHGRLKGWREADSLAFALTAAAWKHSLPGDQLIAGEAEILAAMRGGVQDVKR